MVSKGRWVGQKIWCLKRDQVNNEIIGRGSHVENTRVGGMGGLSSPAPEAGSRRKGQPLSSQADMPPTQGIFIPRGQLTLRHEHLLVR